METLIERYREFVSSKQPLASDEALCSRLDRYHAGEDLAWREISGSYLKPVLEFVESFPSLPRNLNLLNAVEEANVGLVDAIKTFSGTTRDEFWQHAQQTILAWLNSTDDLQD